MSDNDILVMNKKGVKLSIARIAYQIIEGAKDLDTLVLIGIRKGGVYLARRIAQEIKKIEGVEPKVGVLDITLYRDDLDSNKPIFHKTEIPFSIDKKRVVLVDDVLFTGRTVRAALDGLMAAGRPKSVSLAVLIDRGNREMPIQADYIGKVVFTCPEDHVEVVFEEEEAEDRVFITRKKVSDQ
ncbi:MAG: bifunctional pyr operon transcriptional regulator/uracil phosphoribosyltransferase PyrR [Spirochaetes bacterium]|nr:bifunctional pyr operon transcriptional regulator/uracil phosphoribosyltransferase PyrR [Deltaproteobacteria bacterium]RKY03324.1 MAG: bifunctional pyr operon transcriptional regulator/uracil phosphoribosyltransferase PyrR [Spirochaetota bacterium]